MRLMLATAAAALAVSVTASTAVFAQKKNTDAARASRAEARESLNDSYNRCVSLAKERGFARSDISGDIYSSPVKTFVVRCMQGKQK
jgi:hypothetical protein